jgi:hypothetical protein
MAIVSPNFPDRLWDGSTSNPDRENRFTNQWCNHQDWNQISAEVIAIQEFLLSSGIAGEEIPQFTWVTIDGSERIIIANTSQNFIVGLSLTHVNTDEAISYLGAGKIVLDDWTSVIGEKSLLPGKIYFIASNGLMGLGPPPSGFVIQLGCAQDQNAFHINIKQSIRL